MSQAVIYSTNPWNSFGKFSLLCNTFLGWNQTVWYLLILRAIEASPWNFSLHFSCSWYRSSFSCNVTFGKFIEQRKLFLFKLSFRLWPVYEILKLFFAQLRNGKFLANFHDGGKSYCTVFPWWKIQFMLLVFFLLFLMENFFRNKVIAFLSFSFINNNNDSLSMVWPRSKSQVSIVSM